MANKNVNGNISLVTSPDVRELYRATLREPSASDLLLTDANKVIGYNAYTSSMLAGNDFKDFAVLGTFEDLLICTWGATEILVNPFTYAHAGLTQITATVLADVVVRRPESFVFGAAK